MSITNAARRFEQRFDAKAERFIWHHPLLGFISIFVGMPLLVLACVCISTIAIAFPTGRFRSRTQCCYAWNPHRYL